VIPMAGATAWVPPGWTSRACADGGLDIRHNDGAAAWIR
jgi:hypothetical protein